MAMAGEVFTGQILFVSQQYKSKHVSLYIKQSAHAMHNTTVTSNCTLKIKVPTYYKTAFFSTVSPDLTCSPRHMVMEHVFHRLDALPVVKLCQSTKGNSKAITSTSFMHLTSSIR